MRISMLLLLVSILLACNNNSPENKPVTTDTSPPAVQIPSRPAIPDTIFSAFGTEPFWSVHVIRDSKIVFHPADGPDVEVPYVSSQAPDSLAATYLSSGNGNQIELRVYKRDCSDGMSDLTHKFAVKLAVNQMKFAGCGRGEDPAW